MNRDSVLHIAAIGEASSESRARKKQRNLGLLDWFPLILLPGFFAVLKFDRPWMLMWTLALSIFFALKWLTWWRARGDVSHSWWRSAAYLLAWPGMDAGAFLDEGQRPALPLLRDWSRAFLNIGIGVVLLWGVARIIPDSLLLSGWTGMLGFVLLLHFGIFQIAALFWQIRGVAAAPIMERPYRAESLSEFWGRRWNRAFRQLGHDLIFCPMRRFVSPAGAAFLVFLISGLVHDLVISVPARGGYGLPTLYFMLQSVGVMVERSMLGRRLGLGRRTRGRLYTLLCTVAPLPLLFHAPFVLRVIVPFMKAVRAL
jgi:hypothetical protein